jgi:hypothetical protein
MNAFQDDEEEAETRDTQPLSQCAMREFPNPPISAMKVNARPPRSCLLQKIRIFVSFSQKMPFCTAGCLRGVTSLAIVFVMPSSLSLVKNF